MMAIRTPSSGNTTLSRAELRGNRQCSRPEPENGVPVSAAFCYDRWTYCAVVVVESVSDEVFVMEDAMLIVIILAIACIGLLSWLFFTLAVYALPVLGGVTVGMWAFSTGAGLAGAFLAGAATAMAILAIAQFLFATVRSPVVRIGVALAFAIPAAIAGYHAVHGIVVLAVPSEGWRQAFAIVGAIIVGATAWIRIAGISQSRFAQAITAPSGNFRAG